MQTALVNRSNWARTSPLMAVLLTRPQRGCLEITREGVRPRVTELATQCFDGQKHGYALISHWAPCPNTRVVAIP